MNNESNTPIVNRIVRVVGIVPVIYFAASIISYAYYYAYFSSFESLKIFVLFDYATILQMGVIGIGNLVQAIPIFISVLTFLFAAYVTYFDRSKVEVKKIEQAILKMLFWCTVPLLLSMFSYLYTNKFLSSSISYLVSFLSFSASLFLQVLLSTILIFLNWPNERSITHYLILFHLSVMFILFGNHYGKFDAECDWCHSVLASNGDEKNFPIVMQVSGGYLVLESSSSDAGKVFKILSADKISAFTLPPRNKK